MAHVLYAEAGKIGGDLITRKGLAHIFVILVALDTGWI
jgi:hypothetical protein